MNLRFSGSVFHRNNKRPWIAKIPATARKLNTVYGNFRILKQSKVLWSSGNSHESDEFFVLEYETKTGKKRRVEATPRK